MLMDSHKSHRKHKKVRKKKKRRHKSSSSSDSSSSEDEWVEAPTASQNSTKSRDEDIQKASAKKEEDNDEWASFSGQFRTREEIQEKRKPKKEERVNLDKLGQSARELNPYWKDGGSGLPEEEKAVVGGGAVGDFGLDWLRRAMRRSKEQALEEKRSLEEVVAERWGSLAKLESLIVEAEEKQRRNSHKSNYDNNDRYQKRKSYDVTNRSDDVTSKRRFMKPNNESSGDEEADHRKRKTDKYGDDEYDKWKKENKRNKTFAKPRDDDEEEKDGKEERRERDRRRDDRERDWRSGRHSSSRSSGGWRKRSADEGGRRRNEEDSEEEEERDGRRVRESTLTSSSSGGWRKKSSSANNDDGKRRVVDDGDVPARNASNDPEPSSRDESKQDGGLVTSSVLTADERNELAAKLVKAEIMGNTELAAELKSRLERAREAAAAPERVVLTVTDGRGFTQPLAAPAAPSNRADASRGKGGKKVKTHDDSGKRVRYFADDDRFTLQEMFEREKRNTAEDQNEMFARLAGKKIGDDDSARDMDDVFEETASRGGGAREAARADERARARAIGQHQRATRAHDNCSWCLDSQHLLKHLVVAIGNKVYLCLPPHESLTEGHCLIVTSQHVTCCVQADEEVWEEIQVFRKALVDMFLEQDLDCVLFEHAAGFSKFPHLVLQCVPLPKEQGDLAPIYFKKAILECETEWSTNKKLVDLAGSKGGVRRCVPRGLPYFFVDFGMQSGYAHVIEDEHLFPKNFAQEIIGGILDVDHNKWRKPRREKFDDQRKKVVEFTKLWKPFDFTKKSDD